MNYGSEWFMPDRSLVTIMQAIAALIAGSAAVSWLATTCAMCWLCWEERTHGRRGPTVSSAEQIRHPY